MFEPQSSIVDLQNDSGFGDQKPWVSGDTDHSSPTHRQLQSLLGGGANMDRVLFKDLVEIVPLVQSLIDRTQSSSFTRRGSMVYTKMPSRKSLSRKVSEPKGRNTVHSLASKKRRDRGDKEVDLYSSRGLENEKEREELDLLRGQVEELQKQLLEKDEILNQMSSLQAKLDELRHECSEKDSFIKSIQLQLSDAKIKLADKQAALEKTQWQAMTSSNEVEKLQQELTNVEGEVSSFMALFSDLTEDGGIEQHTGHYDVTPYITSDDFHSMDDLDAAEMHIMEEARLAYVAAVATAKEKQDEDSIALAAEARCHLQSLVFRESVHY